MSQPRPGRPSMGEAARVKKIGFKASPEEWRRIAAIAKLNGKTTSEFIREAVSEAAGDCTDEPVLRPAC